MLAADLTNEELAVLAKKDEDALNRLVSRNEGFVVFMASLFLTKKGFRGLFSMDVIEDYKQICRIAICRAVKNYKAGSAARFMTYTGRIMHRDMARQYSKDLSYREYITDTLPEEEDTLAEECDEEYGDAYDNGFENKKAVNLDDILPSLQHTYPQLIKEDTEGEQSEDDFILPGPYVFFFKQAAAPGPDKSEGKAGQKKKKYKGIYLGEKNTDDSWRYPVYHEALNNLQIEALLEALYGKNFDEAQREYLSYRYGLENLDPQKLRDTAEHFNLTLANARKIEKAALNSLERKLRSKKLI